MATCRVTASRHPVIQNRPASGSQPFRNPHFAIRNRLLPRFSDSPVLLVALSPCLLVSDSPVPRCTVPPIRNSQSAIRNRLLLRFSVSPMRPFGTSKFDLRNCQPHFPDSPVRRLPLSLSPCLHVTPAPLPLGPLAPRLLVPVSSSNSKSAIQNSKSLPPTSPLPLVTLPQCRLLSVSPIHRFSDSRSQWRDPSDSGTPVLR
jgi:hypothetical protein